MEIAHPPLQGLWLPLITPFRDGELDIASLRRLAAHYAHESIDGLILAATTGEGMCLDDDEVEQLVSVVRTTLEESGKRLPIYLGLSGSYTEKLVKALKQTASWPIDGYLIACPYYTRPSQQGLYQHFSVLAGSTEKPIIIYNIPYRTGVNLGNETMLRLAERSNIVGVKDCCADAVQSFDLLRHRPRGFSVLIGDDPLFYSAIAHGADGGITASAHVHTQSFATIRNKLNAGDRTGALADWNELTDLPRLLFTEPSPSPVKHWLWRTGLIDSPELRLPMVPVTAELARRIDSAVALARQPVADQGP
jgi:4-hydroxy-tetrahydrodipicolinate synthase